MTSNAQVSDNQDALRGPRFRQKILRSTIDLLGERGYPGLSMEAIAERSGVSKVTVYRWWPHKAAVAMDAFLALNAPKVGFGDSGLARQDFLTQMQLVRRFFNGPGGEILRALIAEAQHDRRLAEDFRRRFWEVRRIDGHRVLERGVQRGELRKGLDYTMVLDALYAPLYMRLLVGHAKLDAAFCRSLVETVFDGIAA